MPSSPPSNTSAFQLPGLTFSVSWDDALAYAEIDRLLGGLRVASDDGAELSRRYALIASGAGGGVLWCDGVALTPCAAWPTVVSALIADINRWAIEGFGGFAAHAGVVATGGGAVAFPAVSGAGKSLLTAACVLAGFAYVSDEALCIDAARSVVVPYPKPIALSPGGWALVGGSVDVGGGTGEPEKLMMTAVELGGAVATSELRLADIVRLARRDGAARLVTMPRSDAFALLLRMSFNHYKRPGATFAQVSALAAKSRAWTLEYSHPTAAAECLLAELGS